MSASLATKWSLDTSFQADPNVTHTPAAPELAAWVANTFACNRWGAHLQATVITRTPSSETRLLNDGLIPFYTCAVEIHNGLSVIAAQNNISLPPCPPLLSDPAQEAATSKDTLGAEILHHVYEQMQPLMQLQGRLMDDQSYHWASLVAFMSVASDAYIGKIAETKAETAEGPMAPFIKAVASEKILNACRVIREEMVRCKEEAARTGWRDEEAKQLSEEQLKFFHKYSANAK